MSFKNQFGANGFGDSAAGVVAQAADDETTSQQDEAIAEASGLSDIQVPAVVMDSDTSESEGYELAYEASSGVYDTTESDAAPAVTAPETGNEAIDMSFLQDVPVVNDGFHEAAMDTTIQFGEDQDPLDFVYNLNGDRFSTAPGSQLIAMVDEYRQLRDGWIEATGTAREISAQCIEAEKMRVAAEQQLRAWIEDKKNSAL